MPPPKFLSAFAPDTNAHKSSPLPHIPKQASQLSIYSSNIKEIKLSKRKVLSLEQNELYEEDRRSAGGRQFQIFEAEEKKGRRLDIVLTR